MPKEATERLLLRAREQIDALDIGIPADHFVCHLCLRVLPVSKATTGHYPSTKAGGGQYALQCDLCNSRLGRDIEKDAARYLGSKDWEMTVGPPGAGSIRLPVKLEAEGPAFTVHTTDASNRWEKVRRLMARTSRPDLLEFRLERPHPDALRMAILAWSFSEWSNYSGYGYTASAGAYAVRRMLLDGSVPIPTAAVAFFEDPLVPPLGKPEPMLVVHAEKDVEVTSDIEEFLGIGVGWGKQLIGILPAASDAEGTIYARLEELAKAGKRIQYFLLRRMLADLGFPRMDKVMVISDDASGWRMAITDDIPEEDRKQLARDDYPLRLSPTAGPRRRYPQGHVQEFFVVEDPSATYPRTRPLRRRKRREKGAEELDGLRLVVAVRSGDSGVWHLATHIRRVDGRPKGYVVYCGARVPFDNTTQRSPRGIGFDGSGFVCARCAEVRSVKPAPERPRPRL